MKTRWVLIPLLVASLLLVGIAGVGCYKTTGGGMFIDDCSGARITFGFNAHPVGLWDAKGQFQLVDHGTKTKMHGQFTGTHIGDLNDYSEFWGTCMVNKEGPHYFLAKFSDGGELGDDWVSVWVPGAGKYYSGTLSADSDIVVHVPE